MSTAFSAPRQVRVVFVVVLVAFCALSVAVAIVGHSSARSLAAHSALATGQVVNAEGGSRSANVDAVSFATSDGTSHVTRIAVHHLIAKGTAVQVRYDTTQPSNAELAGPDAADNVGTRFVMWVVAAVASGIIAVFMAVPLARRRTR